MRKLVIILLLSLSACTGDVQPNEVPLPKVVDIRWNLKTSVTGGITRTAQGGEWFQLTNENTAFWCGPVWRDNLGNEWAAEIWPYSITLRYPYREFYIKYLKSDSLILENGGTTYHFKR
jgi:hypothetical protein